MCCKFKIISNTNQDYFKLSHKLISQLSIINWGRAVLSVSVINNYNTIFSQ